MRRGSQTIKTIIISESKDIIIKDNLWFNRWSKFKNLVKIHYPELYKKHILKSILKKDYSIRRIVNWTSIIAEMHDKGYFKNDILRS
jgi:hypothetical protein